MLRALLRQLSPPSSPSSHLFNQESLCAFLLYFVVLKIEHGPQTSQGSALSHIVPVERKGTPYGAGRKGFHGAQIPDGPQSLSNKLKVQENYDFKTSLK